MRSAKAEAAPVEPRLDDRILETLDGLAGRIAFSGLRRALGAHPESLARALRRLEREGLVERADGGYRSLTERPGASEEWASSLRPIAEVELPPGLTSDALFARLAGRWFGSLRWVGVVDRGDARLLTWAQRDGSNFVLLGVERTRVRVFARGPEERDEGKETEDAAYELLFHAVEALRPGASSNGGMTWFAADPAAPRWPELPEN